MEITQIKYFLEVAQSQHITKSAEKLHIAQPSLTQAIHRLEESVGVPLLEARGRNVVLTEYGKYLQKQLIPIMNELELLPQRLREMAKVSDETVHLNVLAASWMVTEAIIEYKQNERNLNFQLIQSGYDDNYDIKITSRIGTAKNKGNVSKIIDKSEKDELVYVCEEKIYLAVPNIEKYAKKKSVRLAEVMDEGFVSLAGSKQFCAICDEYCRKIGFKPRIIFESDNLTAVKNMITANMGIGFWPEFTWGSINKGFVKLLPIEDIDCKREIVISCNLRKMNNENILRFFEYLKDLFDEKYNCGKEKQKAIK